eukprot:7387546-Prymnesium_polylepis.1
MTADCTRASAHLRGPNPRKAFGTCGEAFHSGHHPLTVFRRDTPALLSKLMKGGHEAEQHRQEQEHELGHVCQHRQ